MGKFDKPGTTVALPDIDSLINKGLHTTEPQQDTSEPWDVLLHLTKADKIVIDEMLSQRKIKQPRHTWLLEAVFEKIERERTAK